MKSLVIALSFIFLGNVAIAQDYPNWSISNGIVYRKVYESNSSWKAIGDYFKLALKDITISDSDSTITGECSFLDPTVGNPNFKKLNSPIFCSTPLSFSISVEYKRGRYRVTVRNIMVLDGKGPAAAPLGHGPLDISPFEKLMLNTSGEFKELFVKQMTFYEFAFDKLFNVNADLKEDW